MRATDDRALTRIEFCWTKRCSTLSKRWPALHGRRANVASNNARRARHRRHCVRRCMAGELSGAYSRVCRGGRPVPMPTSWPPNPPYDPNPPTVYIVSRRPEHRSRGQSIEVVIFRERQCRCIGCRAVGRWHLIASESFPHPYQTRQWTPAGRVLYQAITACPPEHGTRQEMSDSPHPSHCRATAGAPAGGPAVLLFAADRESGHLLHPSRGSDLRQVSPRSSLKRTRGFTRWTNVGLRTRG